MVGARQAELQACHFAPFQTMRATVTRVVDSKVLASAWFSRGATGLGAGFKVLLGRTAMIDLTGEKSVGRLQRNPDPTRSLSRCLELLETSNSQQAVQLMDAAEEQLEQSGLPTVLKESGRRRMRNARRYFESDESSAAHWELRQFHRSLLKAGSLPA